MITNIHSLHGLLHGFRKSCSSFSNSSQDIPHFPPNLCQNSATSGEPTSAWRPRPSCEASCEAGWRSGGPKPSEVLPILRLLLPLLLLMCYNICSGVDVYIVYLSLTKLMVGIYDWSYGLWQPIIYGIPIDQAVRWDVMCVISWLNLSIWEAATVVQWWLASTSMPESARDELLPGKLDATSTSHPIQTYADNRESKLQELPENSDEWLIQQGDEITSLSNEKCPAPKEHMTCRISLAGLVPR